MNEKVEDTDAEKLPITKKLSRRISAGLGFQTTADKRKDEKKEQRMRKTQSCAVQ